VMENLDMKWVIILTLKVAKYTYLVHFYLSLWILYVLLLVLILNCARLFDFSMIRYKILSLLKEISVIFCITSL